MLSYPCRSLVGQRQASQEGPLLSLPGADDRIGNARDGKAEAENLKEAREHDLSERTLILRIKVEVTVVLHN